MRVQWSEPDGSVRETADRGASIPESHAAGTMPIEQCVQCLDVQKILRAARDILKLLLVLDEFAQVVKPVRIQQAQAGEMAGHAELFRSRGQKQETGSLAGKRLDQSVFRTDGLGRPRKMMRFIDDEDVPAGSDGLFDSPLARREQTDAAQYKLVIEKRIFLGIESFDGPAPLFIEDVEPEIETAKQLHEPLMDERVRHEDEHPLST